MTGQERESIKEPPPCRNVSAFAHSLWPEILPKKYGEQNKRQVAMETHTFNDKAFALARRPPTKFTEGFSSPLGPVPDSTARNNLCPGGTALIGGFNHSFNKGPSPLLVCPG